MKQENEAEPPAKAGGTNVEHMLRPCYLRVGRDRSTRALAWAMAVSPLKRAKKSCIKRIPRRETGRGWSENHEQIGIRKQENLQNKSPRGKAAPLLRQGGEPLKKTPRLV